MSKELFPSGLCDRLFGVCSPLRLAMIGSLIVVAVGCRSATDNQIDLLERELRTQEDYIYELEDYVLEYSEKLRQYRRSQPTVIYQDRVEAEPPIDARPIQPKFQPKLQPKQHHEPSESSEEELLLPEPAEELPAEESPAEQKEFDPEDIVLPDLDDDFGALDSEAVDSADSVRQVADEVWDDVPNDELNDENQAQLLFIPDPTDFVEEELVSMAGYRSEEDSQTDEPEQFVEEEESEDVGRVAQQLEITRIFRGADDGHAPTSLLTVVEALDANNEPVDLDGEVALMVMTVGVDSPQRLKRWNFSSDETASAWQSSQLGDGLHLELPLEGTELSEGPLELWARLVTSDGRKLLTQVAFDPTALEAIEAAVDPEEEPDPADATRLVVADSPVENSHQSEQPLANESSLDISPTDEPRSPAEPPTTKPLTMVAEGPRWRPSMRRTNVVTKNYSTTAPGAQRWIAQPLGGRIPFSFPAVAGRPGRLEEPVEPAAPDSQTVVPTSGRAGTEWVPYR